MARSNDRRDDQLRPVTMTRAFQSTSAGSVMYRAGRTTLLVSAQISDQVPGFLEGKGKGWLTAEYAMLPGSTPTRKERRPDGRATEIQRLIGRSLRAAVDLDALGKLAPCTIHVDADVLEADGGTRTAAITAAFVAVVDALNARFGLEGRSVIRDAVAAVSVGIVAGQPLLDLDYREDSKAAVDFNAVRLAGGGFVELQGTGEGGTFSRQQLDTLVDLANRGLERLFELQREALGPVAFLP
jgi:ribonuclease PH